MNAPLHAWLLAILMTALAQPYATDLDGRAVQSLAPAGSKAVVLFFAASDCPISNRYIPELQRLAKLYDPQGVRILFVYPNPGDNAQVIRAHNLEYALGEQARTVIDAKQTLTRMAQATVTPEAAVFLPDGSGWREVYRGRIDDRYVAFGKERPKATHQDLEDAIRAVLASKPVPQPQGPPVGCSIVPPQP